MIGGLLQALLDLRQAGLIGVIALLAERPLEELVGFAPTLLVFGAQAFGLGSLALDFRSLPFDFRPLPFGFGFQPFGLGFLPLLGGFHLQARGFLLALAFGLLGQNGFFQGQ